MQIRQSIHGEHAKQLDATALHRDFLIEKMFIAEQYTMAYSHIDHIIIGGIMPVNETVLMGAEMGKQLDVNDFLEQRELGTINLGHAGVVTVDGQRFEIGHKEALYIGKGAKNICFSSLNPADPAKFYYNSSPTNKTYPTRAITQRDITPLKQGEQNCCDVHTVNQSLIPDRLSPCQLMSGITKLAEERVCNNHTYQPEGDLPRPWGAWYGLARLYLNCAQGSNMRLSTQLLTICTSVAFLVTPSITRVQSSANTGITVEKLLETEKSWDGVFYKEYPKGRPQLSVLKFTIPPNTSLAWHEHSIPNAAYVQNGILIVENKATGEKRLLKAGEVLPEMVGSAHRGYTNKKGATLVVFYAGEKGIPLSTPAK